MAEYRKKTGGLVYSSGQGRMCLHCRRPVDACVCKTTQPAPSDGIVRVGRETKGRKGKGVTIITGVPLAGADLAAFASSLKKRCGTGGTVKNGVIEIQGDHRDLLVGELARQGWQVKRSGG